MKNNFTDEQNKLICQSYHACMEENASSEQQLIWELSNAVTCVKVKMNMYFQTQDEDYKNEALKILNDYDSLD